MWSFGEHQDSLSTIFKSRSFTFKSLTLPTIYFPAVHDLIHWRDPKKSGVVFGLSLLLLLSLAAFSVISVVSYLLLALLCVTITFRIYKSVIQAVQKSSDGHPFK